MLGDSWILSLAGETPEWTRLFDTLPEVQRRNGTYVFDPEGVRLLLWGGTADGATTREGLSILRLLPGQERWDHIDTPVSVPPRTSGMAVYDADGRRAIMGMGNSDAIYTDLYALSL